MRSKALLDELRQKAPLISVGVLSADLMALGSQLKLLEEAGVELLHFDIMDGCFCPMMTVGSGFVEGIKTPLVKDVHLLIEEPLDKIAGYVAAGADMITVHVESCRHIHRVLQALGEMTNANDPARGILRGIALNPGTPLETVPPLLDEVEMAFLLAVNPGWGGQKFIASTERRVRLLIEMFKEAKRDILVGIDGGVTRENIAQVARMGADIIVTGSAVFRGGAPLQNAKSMIDVLKDAVDVRR
jgi:ribulose-phosphate 3-epimerase